MKDNTTAYDGSAADEQSFDQAVHKILVRSSRLAARQPTQTQRSVDLFLSSDRDERSPWLIYS